MSKKAKRPSSRSRRERSGMNRTVPTEEGFYWATSIRRIKSKRLPGGGQIGGLRWIVRVIDYSDIYDDGRPMKVQVFGDCADLMDLCDYTDWEGPLGKPHMVDTPNNKNKGEEK